MLAPVAKYTKEYDPNWEPDVAKLPVVISFPGTELKSRDVVIGLTVDGAARAYPWETFAKQSPVLDRVNGTPLLLVLGPDGKSFRVFVSRVDGHDAEFFLQAGAPAETQPGKSSDAKEDETTKTGRCSTPPPPASGTSRAAPPPARRRESVSTAFPL